MQGFRHPWMGNVLTCTTTGISGFYAELGGSLTVVGALLQFRSQLAEALSKLDITQCRRVVAGGVLGGPVRSVDCLLLSAVIDEEQRGTHAGTDTDVDAVLDPSADLGEDLPLGVGHRQELDDSSRGLTREESRIGGADSVRDHVLEVIEVHDAVVAIVHHVDLLLVQCTRSHLVRRDHRVGDQRLGIGRAGLERRHPVKATIRLVLQ